MLLEQFAMLLDTEADTCLETLTLSDNSPRNPATTHAGVTDLRAMFSGLIPSKPYCADTLADGLRIKPRARALERRHIQFNGPATFQWMVHDIDHREAYFAHDDANLPPPNVIVCNPANGHAHAAYLLRCPVARHNAARLKPLRYYAAVERGVRRRLAADRHYTGLIAKNPLHPSWRAEWRRDQPYALDELADYLFERDRRPEPSVASTFGAGRNVTVFDQLRQAAYREIRTFKRDHASLCAWVDQCERLALAINAQFPEALHLVEVRAIARSVAKWTWRHFTIDRFQRSQSRRGKGGMAKRWQGHAAASRSEPWKALGFSRATYYRRKRLPATHPSAIHSGDRA
jgi:hypothetical protein